MAAILSNDTAHSTPPVFYSTTMSHLSS